MPIKHQEDNVGKTNPEIKKTMERPQVTNVVKQQVMMKTLKSVWMTGHRNIFKSIPEDVKTTIC